MSLTNLRQLYNYSCNRFVNQANNFVRRFVYKNNDDTNTNDKSQNDSSNPNSNGLLISFLSSFESYVVSLQSLLIWERPYLSAVAFVSLNCLFWLIVSWSRRFYSILSLIFIIMTFYKLWTKHIWPEIRVPPTETNQDNEGWIPVHPQVLSVPEISYYLNEISNMIYDYYLWLIELRKTNHGLFCLIITGFLIMTALIGRIVPGVIIVYAIMMTFALGPGIALYVIPVNWFENICLLLKQKVKKQDQKVDDISRVDSQNSLLPDICEETAKELFLAEQCDYSFDSTKTISDESSLQLISSSQLNSTLDEELGIRLSDINNDNDDYLTGDIQFESELPSLSDNNNKNNSSPARSERSSQCSSCSNGMHFVSSHFSRNSSVNDLDADYELISDSEIQDSPKKTQTTPRESSV